MKQKTFVASFLFVWAFGGVFQVFLESSYEVMLLDFELFSLFIPTADGKQETCWAQHPQA